MTTIPRRTMIGGTALAALASAAPAPGGPRPSTLERSYPSTPVDSVPDRRALARLADPVAGRIVYLAEGARAGLFRCMPGRAPAGDPLQGLFVPAAAGEFHYAREWDGTNGHPEWFGAITGDARADCADAIEACYALCPVTQLAQADYFVRRTMRFARSWRAVRGCGRYAREQGQGTRIILQAGAADVHSADIVLVGSLAYPGSDAGLVTENHFADFTLVRDGASAPHPSGDLLRYPTGLRASFLLRCSFTGVTVLESSVGFSIGGVIYTKFDDCFAQRTRPGTSGARDYWVGWYLNGNISFGYAGGNASLYMSRCLAADQHGSHVDPVGLLAVGAFVDSFIDDFESARIATGIALRVAGARSFGQTVDVHLRGAVLDGCSRSGIDIDLDATSTACIEIVDPYVAGSGSGGSTGIGVHDGAGLVTITGGQIHGGFRDGSLFFNRTRGISVHGTKIMQSLRPVVVGEASGLVLEPQIKNVGTASPHFAIDCRNLTRSIVRPTVIGTNGPSFAGGISLGAESSYNAVDGSAVDPGCFATADAGRKLWFGGGDARGRPAFAAKGNVLAGVTG